MSYSLDEQPPSGAVHLVIFCDSFAEDCGGGLVILACSNNGKAVLTLQGR